jgi:general secretion pathway protein L
MTWRRLAVHTDWRVVDAMISEIKAFFEEWIAAVARTVAFALDRYAPGRQILLSEASDQTFTASLKSMPEGLNLPDASFRLSHGRPEPPFSADWEAAFRGGRVEALIAPEQILFRSLDFPEKAVDFLDGMIGTQIDRLTPWTADDAAFGWTSPSTAPNGRIELTLAATSRQEIQPLVQFATSMGAASIAAFAALPATAGASTKIKVFDQPISSAIGRALDVPRILRLILLGTGLAAATSMMVATYVGSYLDSEQQQLMRRISERRASLRLTSNSGESAFELLAKRKQTSPSSVVVLEALSQALPDGTYVTELRIEGDKVQVVGMTQNAPSLIKLMEKSPQFARATFFAPTTRAQNEPGERFHIEARITPSFGSGT